MNYIEKNDNNNSEKKESKENIASDQKIVASQSNIADPIKKDPIKKKGDLESNNKCCNNLKSCQFN